MRGIVTWVGSSSLEVSVSIVDEVDRSRALLVCEDLFKCMAVYVKRCIVSPVKYLKIA